MTVPPRAASVALLATGLVSVTAGVWLTVGGGIALIVVGGLLIAGDLLIP